MVTISINSSEITYIYCTLYNEIYDASILFQFSNFAMTAFSVN